jgi:uncharacterized membrane protein YhiD involved in acid resistance
MPNGVLAMPNLVNLELSMSALALGLSFVLCLMIALVYTRINRELPNVRAFAQTLAVSGVVSSMIVLAVGDNIARGLGLVGALTIVRFRSTLKDPRDLIFAFAALATGVAAGAHAFLVAVLGTVVFLCANLIVSLRWFANTDTFNAVLSLRTPSGTDDVERISRVLRRECREFVLVRVRQAGVGVQEHAYQLRLKQPERQSELLGAISQLEGVDGALLLAYEGLDV